MKHFGLIGHPLGHSFSADYFNGKFHREHIDADYSLLDIDSIEDVTDKVSGLNGFNVTIPYKRAIIPYLAGISNEALAIGAVNCVKIENGAMYGYNTDVEGIRTTLKQYRHTPGSKALILGSGGASAAVGFVLDEAGIEYNIVSRSNERGNITYPELTADIIADRQLIINTTPLGMYPKTAVKPDIPYSAVTCQHTLFDLIYNPEHTEFLKEGAARGAATINGTTMFISQAEASWRIWTE